MRTSHSRVRLGELVLVWHKCKSRAAVDRMWVLRAPKPGKEGGRPAFALTSLRGASEIEQVVHFL